MLYLVSTMRAGNVSSTCYVVVQTARVRSRCMRRNCCRARPRGIYCCIVRSLCDWNLNFIHRLVYIRPVTYSNRTDCIRASCVSMRYLPPNYNPSSPIISPIFIVIIRPNGIRKGANFPSILTEREREREWLHISPKK